MAATEKPTVDTTIKTCYEGVGKQSQKPYMMVTLGNGQKTSNFATEMFQDFKDAMESGAQVRLTLYRSPKGYVSIDAIDPVPRPGDPSPEHFLGAGGAPAGTPGTPENPGPRAAAPAGGNGGAAARPGTKPASPVGSPDALLGRAFTALAAGMVAWGGKFAQSEDELWKLIAKFQRFVEDGDIPGIKKPDPVVRPDASPGEELPNYDEDL